MESEWEWKWVWEMQKTFETETQYQSILRTESYVDAFGSLQYRSVTESLPYVRTVPSYEEKLVYRYVRKDEYSAPSSDFHLQTEPTTDFSIEPSQQSPIETPFASSGVELCVLCEAELKKTLRLPKNWYTSWKSHISFLISVILFSFLAYVYFATNHIVFGFCVFFAILSPIMYWKKVCAACEPIKLNNSKYKRIENKPCDCKVNSIKKKW